MVMVCQSCSGLHYNKSGVCDLCSVRYQGTQAIGRVIAQQSSAKPTPLPEAWGVNASDLCRATQVIARPMQKPRPTPSPTSGTPQVALEPTVDQRFVAWVGSWTPDQAKTAALFSVALVLLAAAVWSQIV